MQKDVSTVIMDAKALEGKLGVADKAILSKLDDLYAEVLSIGKTVAAAGMTKAPARLVELYDQMGKAMQGFIASEPRIKVYPFTLQPESHGEASRLIAKLRDQRTPRAEFVYHIQRAFELLFKLAYHADIDRQRNYLMVQTPVTQPGFNYAVHRLPNIDNLVRDSVMCVLLRGALLPSMIMSKEIQEYSSEGLITPFALFRIKRNDQRSREDMEYIMDLKGSYFDPAALDGKDLVFADPMNATGGSLVAVLEYLQSVGVRPRSVICFNVIASMAGALQIVRSVPNAQVYTLWMDPVLNEKAYIMPGLGDAGDRLNGRDTEQYPRNIIQLIADYGANMADLYRAQVREIERTVLGGRGGR